MHSLTQSVTREIRAEMAREGLSQQELARQMVWTPAYLSRRLLGEVSWSLDDLEEIANILEIPMLRLVWPVQREQPQRVTA